MECDDKTRQVTHWKHCVRKSVQSSTTDARLLRLDDASVRFGTLGERHGAIACSSGEKDRCIHGGITPCATFASGQQTANSAERFAARNLILAQGSSGFTKPVGCTWTHSGSMVLAPIASPILITSPVQCSPCCCGKEHTEQDDMLPTVNSE